MGGGPHQWPRWNGNNDGYLQASLHTSSVSAVRRIAPKVTQARCIFAGLGKKAWIKSDYQIATTVLTNQFFVKAQKIKFALELLAISLFTIFAKPLQLKEINAALYRQKQCKGLNQKYLPPFVDVRLRVHAQQYRGKILSLRRSDKILIVKGLNKYFQHYFSSILLKIKQLNQSLTKYCLN